MLHQKVVPIFIIIFKGEKGLKTKICSGGRELLLVASTLTKDKKIRRELDLWIAGSNPMDIFPEQAERDFEFSVLFDHVCIVSK